MLQNRRGINDLKLRIFELQRACVLQGEFGVTFCRRVERLPHRLIFVDVQLADIREADLTWGGIREIKSQQFGTADVENLDFAGVLTVIQIFANRFREKIVLGESDIGVNGLRYFAYALFCLRFFLRPT